MSALVAVTVALASLGAATPASAAQSGNSFAGYKGYSASGFTSATGEVAIPTLTCGSSDSGVHYITLGWGDLNGLEFAAAGLFIGVACSGGGQVVTASAIVSDLNSKRDKPLAASGGDVLATTFTYDPVSGDVTLSARNKTTSQRVGIRRNEPARTFQYPEFTFDDAIGSGTPIPPFSKIHFGRLTIDGEPAASELTLQGYNERSMSNGCYCGDLLVRALPFNAAGTGFNLSFVASS